VGVRRIRANGIDVAYTLQGPGHAPVVAFSNSLCSDLTIWDDISHALQMRYRVLRYDLRGHGQTDATESEYSISSLSSDFIALLDELAIPKVHLVGLSIGGMIAQHIAAVSPQRVSNVVLCATAFKASPGIWEPRIAAARSAGLAGLVEPTLARWFSEETRTRCPKMIDSVATMIAATSVPGYVGCAAALRDLSLSTIVGNISAPTLLISGGDDKSTTPSEMAELQSLIPRSDIVVLPRAAHLLPLERPYELTGLISGFLDRNSLVAGSEWE
jgi:3-oxoadipate enol-lactonase